MSAEIDIPITLKPGVVRTVGRIRVRVVSHIYGSKPRFVYVGPALRHQWERSIHGKGEYCARCDRSRRPYGNGPCRGLDE